ncbi:MAG: hypothetical protein ABR555_05095 [Pyrinomonadaceae bacterium]
MDSKICSSAAWRGLFLQTNYERSRSDTQYVTDVYYAYLQRGPARPG